MIGATHEALSATEVCALVNGLGSAIQQPPLSGVLGGAVQLSCNPEEIRHTYYNGAELLTNSLEDLFNLPYVTTGAYLCGMADADGATVDARLGGAWGLSSQFNVIQRDPAHGHVLGRRVGTVWMFGVPAKLLVQDIDVSTLPEQSSNSIPPWWGAYEKLDSQGINWDFDVNVTFPIGAIFVNIHPQFHSRGPTVTETNNGVFFDPTTTHSGASTNALSPEFSYTNWLSCLSSGTVCEPRSDVDNSTFMLEHLVSCAGDPNNLTDHFLPYYSPFGGAGCATQNWIFPDVLHNWFQFGRPSAPPGALMADEPGHAIGDPMDTNNNENNATFWSSLEVKTDFNIELVDISLDATLSVAARDGFSVRQEHHTTLDFGYGESSTSEVMTGLDAQSKAKLDIKSTINFGGFFPTIHLDFPFDLGDTGNVESRPGNPAPITDLQYNDISNTQLFTGLNFYQVKGVNKPSPDAARLQCVTAPATTAPTVHPDNPGNFLKQVATAAVNTVHPCNVKTCTDAQHETDYNWDSTKMTLVKGKTGACSICYQLSMNICDGSGGPMPDPTHPGHTVLIQDGTLSPLPLGCVR